MDGQMDEFMARPLAGTKGHMFVFKKHAQLQLWLWGSGPNTVTPPTVAVL